MITAKNICKPPFIDTLQFDDIIQIDIEKQVVCAAENDDAIRRGKQVRYKAITSEEKAVAVE